MTSPWRAIAKRRAARAQERRLLQELIERLVTELERDPWSSNYRPRMRNSTAHILAEPVLARRGIGRPEDTTAEEG
jgi:hypothetical protein